MTKLLILLYLLGCFVALLVSQTTGWIVPLSAAHHANAGRADSYSRRHSAVFASSHDSIMPDTVTDLLKHAGIDANNVDIEKVNEKAAFCNTLYRIRYNNNTTCIAKVFSPLALQRMDPDPSRTLGELDRLAASAGLAPEILASNLSGILMEACVGRVLTEELVQQPNFSESANVASALARLHHLPVAPSETNMLWQACDVMLSLTDEAHMNTSTGWTVSRLHHTIEQHREQLHTLQLPITACGHGDCKPSNVFLTDNDTIGTDMSVKFIDLELAGTHYRAFDLAKFWRTNSNDSTDRNRNIFYEAYAATSNTIAGGKPALLDNLELEVDLLLPLTWLEAALFFVCMATQDAAPAPSNHWNELALDRLESYTQCMQGKRFDRLFVL
jgi:thiamine kinase-like enzyme